MLKFNVTTGQFDYIRSIAWLDGRFVNVTGDLMKGNLGIQPSTNSLSALYVNDKDGNNVLTVDTINNRVGVGLTNPTEKFMLGLGPNSPGNLAISSYGFFGVQYSSGALVLGYNAKAYSGTTDKVVVANTNSVVGYSYIQLTYNNGIRFCAYKGAVTAGDTAAVEVMRINNTNGNVGIGTNNPSQKLDVLGSGKFSINVLTPQIKTDTTSATDLIVTTGASKTIVLANVAKLSMRPTIIASKIVKVGAGFYMKPTQVDYGASSGYSLPIYAADDEELYFNELVAGRWDEASDITVSVIGYLSANEDANDDFKLQLSWANKSTSSGIFPSTMTDVEVVTNIPDARKSQYSIYKVDFTIDWNVNDPDILVSDIFCGRLRRIAVGAGNVEMSGEFVVQAIVITYSVNKVFKRA